VEPRTSNDPDDQEKAERLRVTTRYCGNVSVIGGE